MRIRCFKMAEDNAAQDALSSSTSYNNEIVTPFGRISPVWKQFGYKKDASSNLSRALKHIASCVARVLPMAEVQLI